MPRLPAFLAALLLLAAAAGAQTARIPLDPASLAGADIFTRAETHLAQAAQAAGLAFVPGPRPLPPQVILQLDTPARLVQKRNGLLLWRGDMLPDQLAPGETGTLVRKRRQPDGSWKTIRTRSDFQLAAQDSLRPVAIPLGAVPHAPSLIIETPYQLGTIAETPVALVLWRTAEEGSAPLAGFIALPAPPPAFLAALAARLPAFPSQSLWAADFALLSP